MVSTALAVLFCGCAGDGADGFAPTTTSTTVPGGGGAAFIAVQREVLAPSCATSGCHDSATRAAGLRLTDAETSYNSLVGAPSTCGGAILVVPDEPGSSYLMRKLGEGAPPCGSRMPPGGAALSPADIARIRDWIAGGAKPPDSAAMRASGFATTSTSSTTTTTVEERG